MCSAAAEQTFPEFAFGARCMDHEILLVPVSDL
jgi:hypothetical protein